MSFLGTIKLQSLGFIMRTSRRLFSISWLGSVSFLQKFLHITQLELTNFLGWATDLKTVSPEMIKKRVLRTGDGSHPIYKDRLNERSSEEEPKRDLEHFWGWNDELMTEEDKKDALITHITEQE